MVNRKVVAPTLLAAAMLLGTGAAHAQVGPLVTAPFLVSAVVQEACSLAMGFMSFPMLQSTPTMMGMNTPMPDNITYGAQTTMNIVCTNGTNATVTANDGNNALDGVRRMRRGAGTGATDYIAYQLYKDGAANDPLTSTSGISVVGTGSLSGQQTVTIIGRIPSGAANNARAGSFTDFVILTVSYGAGPI